MASLTIAPPAVFTTYEKAAGALQAAIRAVLRPWEQRPGPDSTFRFVVQQENNRVLLLHEENGEQTPLVLAHFELRDNKIWLMKNETDTDFGEALVREGVERDQIVLGFLSPNARKNSGYAAE